MDIFKLDNIDNYTDSFYNIFLKKIKEGKRRKIEKKINIEDKKRSILGEYLFMNALKELNIDYKEIEIYYNSNDKPYIKDQNIFYNISHKGNYVCIYVSSKDVGIDIEIIKDYNETTLNYVSTEKERKKIKNSLDFYTLYTLKEAYFKMLGTNIFDMKDVEFYLNKKITSNKKVIPIVKHNKDYVISIIKKC